MTFITQTDETVRIDFDVLDIYLHIRNQVIIIITLAKKKEIMTTKKQPIYPPVDFDPNKYQPSSKPQNNFSLFYSTVGSSRPRAGSNNFTSSNYGSQYKIADQSPLSYSSYNPTYQDYSDVRKIPDSYNNLRQTTDSRSNNRIRDMISKLNTDKSPTDKYETSSYNKPSTNSYQAKPNDRERFRNYQLQNKLAQYSKIANKFDAQLESTNKMSQEIEKLKEDRRKRQAKQRQFKGLQYSGGNSYSTSNLNSYNTSNQAFSKTYGGYNFDKYDQQRKKRQKEEQEKKQRQKLFKKVKAQNLPTEQYTGSKYRSKYENIDYKKYAKEPTPTYTTTSATSYEYKGIKINTAPTSSYSSLSKTLSKLENEKIQYVQVNNFILGKSLGEGKFGVVYQAVHKPTGWLFAIKKVPKETIKNHYMIDQFILQLKLQAFLNHQNILTLFTQFDDKQAIYLVLEYMEEGTLFTHLKKNKCLPEPQVATKIKQIASAVKYLHENQIAHRDIKPENIVMSHGVCKLCDFGWATICDNRRKTYCGTFDYAPPEILQGSQYDYTVDLWCLGVLAYQLLIGKVPFYHISKKQTMKKILNVQNTNLEFNPTISRNAKSFIQNLIKKDPKDRLSSQMLLQHPFLKYSDKEVMKKY